MNQVVIDDAFKIYRIICRQFYNESAIPDNVNKNNIFLCMQSDMDDLLTKAEDASAKYIELHKMIVDNSTGDSSRARLIPVLDNALQAAAIRRDWARALRGVRKSTDLGVKIGWGFSNDDLYTLVELHRKNKFRKKIEDLLEDCNFHEFCGLLSAGEYEAAITQIGER